MDDMRYNFLDNNFTVYENVDAPKITKLSLPLGDIDLSDSGLFINSKGVVQAENNISSPQQESKFIINNTEEVPIENYENYTPTTVSKNITGDKKKAMEFFQSKGLSAHASAGIVGNLMQESGLNTTIKGDGGKAFGMAQWHPDRQKGLKELAKKMKLDISDPTVQLEYIWQELNTSHKSALDGLLKSRNVDEATTVFMRRFEKPNEKYANLKGRIKFASSLLS